MSTLQRLEKLKRTASPARGFVILRGDGETNDQAITAVGINPDAQDMVILIGKMGSISPTEKRFVSEFAMVL